MRGGDALRTGGRRGGGRGRAGCGGGRRGGRSSGGRDGGCGHRRRGCVRSSHVGRAWHGARTAVRGWLVPPVANGVTIARCAREVPRLALGGVLGTVADGLSRRGERGTIRKKGNSGWSADQTVCGEFGGLVK